MKRALVCSGKVYYDLLEETQRQAEELQAAAALPQLAPAIIHAGRAEVGLEQQQDLQELGDATDARRIGQVRVRRVVTEPEPDDG